MWLAGLAEENRGKRDRGEKSAFAAKVLGSSRGEEGG